jgi:hypothetical protein
MGTFFTVAENGALVLPALPVSLNVQSIQKLGANYFLDTSSRLYLVDKDGNVLERTISGHDLSKTKIISL